MVAVRTEVLAFNRGIVSKLGLARTDVRRVGFSAEQQTNWVPRVLGSMMLRPGLEYITTGHESGGSFPIATIPFVFSATEKAVLEFAGNPLVSHTGILRVIVNDEVVERADVATEIADFIEDLNDWDDKDEGGTAASLHEADTAFQGFMHLTGDGTFAAAREQLVTVSGTDADTEHAVRVTVVVGPVMMRIGSTSGGEEYVADMALEAGDHSIAFTPEDDFYIRFWNRSKRRVTVSQAFIEVEGVMTLSTDYDDDDIELLRYTQSGDVVFLACKGLQQRKVLRWSDRSWSLVKYETLAGPFRKINATDVTLKPSALEGNITITASAGIFREEHVGAQFRIASHGQRVSKSIAAENTFSDPIRVTGSGDSRIFDLDITGTFSATVTLQYSVAEPGNWVDLPTTYTAATDTTIDDGLDNQVVYYRIGVKTGDYTSGTVTVTLAIATGSITGIAKITEYTSATQLKGYTLRAFGGTDESKDWWESAWSDFRGWPTAVALFEGRLWWAGEDTLYGSVSDDYENFDDEEEGDAGPVVRSIGFGPIQSIHWLLPLERLILGTALNSANVPAAVIDGNNPIAAISSALDEPLTPTNFGLRATAPIGLFVDRSVQRLYAMAFDGRDYVPDDLTKFVPDLNDAGITRIAVQHKPDVRVHCVRDDGTAGLLVFDRLENVYAWVEVETDGEIEDVCVLPGSEEDDVYYVVTRTIDGTDHRYIEKWAKESECQGGTLNKQADSFIVYSGTSTTSITGLDHLEGETVVAWGAGKDLGEYTVSGGAITLTESVTSCIVGLPYTARRKSNKLASIDGFGLTKHRKAVRIGVIMHKAHFQGLKYGPSFDKLYSLPKVADGKVTADDTVWDDFDEATFPFGGTWDTDARICLQADAPRPCTLLALVVDIES